MSEENELKAIQEELTDGQLEGVSGGGNNTNQSGGTNQSSGGVVRSDFSIIKNADQASSKLMP